MNTDAPKKAVDLNGPEPVAERWTVPMWLLVVTALLIYGGALYVSDNGGDFAKDVYNPYNSSEEVALANPQDPAAVLRREGRQVFEKTCIACHQATGLGQAGTFPPLAGSEWVLAPGANRIAHVVLYGLTGPITVKGQQFNNTMLAWRDVYTDEQLAAVLTYIRSSWGNNATPVTPEMLKAARKDGRTIYESSDELLKLPLQ